MRNTYVISPKRGDLGLAQRVNEAAKKLPSAMVRKSDPGEAVRSDGRVETIRWAFAENSIRRSNNAGEDKLEV
jgi:hypothetical protein